MTLSLITTAEQRANFRVLAKRAGGLILTEASEAWALAEFQRSAIALVGAFASDVETLLAANKALEDEKRCPIGLDSNRDVCSAGTCVGCLLDRIGWYRSRADQLEQALKRAGEVTDEKLDKAVIAFANAVWGESSTKHNLQRLVVKQGMRAALTAALAIQPKGDGEP